MNKLQKKIASSIAAVALLVNMAMPVMATTIVLTGNGSNSDNDAEVVVVSTTNVVQTNVADITNDVDVDADTGDNSADDNTGGDVSIDTGDADVAVAVVNTANTNTADIEGCCGSDAEVLISNNGSDSDNDVALELVDTTAVFQTNDADVDNDVDVDTDTGDNSADDNTGGTVEIDTGNTEVAVVLSTAVNTNSARVGGDSGGSLVSARIIGNGSGSDNDIKLGLVRSLVLDQVNLADLTNDVDVDADTGDNSADDSTGGDVSIDTGNAKVGVGIDNMANFNSADIDCGCLLDVTAKIAGNASPSDNTIKAMFADSKLVFQTNDWDCGRIGRCGWSGGSDCNDVDVDADTGGNDVTDSTGEPGVDPAVDTGNAEVEVLIENAGNANSVGTSSGSGFQWPSGFSFNLNLSFSLADLLAALGGLV